MQPTQSYTECRHDIVTGGLVYFTYNAISRLLLLALKFKLCILMFRSLIQIIVEEVNHRYTSGQWEISHQNHGESFYNFSDAIACICKI